MPEKKITPLREPDFSQFLRILERGKPDRPTLFEFLTDEKVVLDEDQVSASQQDAAIHQYIRCFMENGFDFASLPTWVTGFLDFPKGDRSHGESVSQNEGGIIHDEASFADYPWPDPSAADYSVIKRWEKWLPEGAKFILMSPGGVLELLTDLVGFEDLCFMMLDEPDLVSAIAEGIGTRMLTYYARQLEYDSVGACVVNDDWGYKTSTMFSPAMMREFVIPWHRKIVALIHDAGRPAILHSCGNLGPLWEDVIEDIGYDAKQSFEDSILPVEQAYEQYGNRIAILGGIDVGFLCDRTPEEIKCRAKNLIELTDGCRGYAVGSGNSITRYVPRRSFLALRDAVLESR
jgi:uroporphyrinogen decarboxylase